MDIYASDEEKGEEIKQWWRENGRTVVVAALAAILAVFSGRYWLDYQSTQSLQAAQAYQQVFSALNREDATTAESGAEDLFSNFPNSPYAVFSSFEMAANSVKNKDYTSAEVYLKWITEHAEMSAHKDLAQLRLAQVLLLSGKYDEALALADAAPASEFSSLWLELKGDIYIAQSKTDLAREAYQSALVTLTQGEPRQQILKIKLDDVAASTNG